MGRLHESIISPLKYQLALTNHAIVQATSEAQMLELKLADTRKRIEQNEVVRGELRHFLESNGENPDDIPQQYVQALEFVQGKYTP